MYCEFRPIGGVSWTQFKVLSIGHAALSNEIIAEVLVESPLLESLKLQSCDGVNEIIIDEGVGCSVLSVWECHSEHFQQESEIQNMIQQRNDV
ncbi:hypothetical protein CUMW_011040, partial [Citrus unshiu]